jgi:hypothetical protein
MDKVVEAQQAVVRALFNNVVQKHGGDCVGVYRSAGFVGEDEVRVVDSGRGISPSISGGGRVGMAWHRLREVMAEQPGRGAWFTTTVRVSTDGRYSFDFDYDNEPDWHIRPLDETYMADLEKYPRPPDQIPAWHPGHPSHRKS